ncbi:MAG: 2-oxoacid:acceptor oxidoreductase family protein [Candidatus Omnitrophica bacterium]|nr:2-oxoacid:acceptor oxidoreductase family protein [Candidatus Omnitrophota bacterium]
MPDRITNLIIAGLGGQGVLKASDILAEAAMRAGFDVKKSEVHGMSQRGGSVRSDVRFGDRVFSPIVPAGETDFLVIMAPDQAEPYRSCLAANGRIIGPEGLSLDELPNKKSLNIALLGRLSHYLAIPMEIWLAAIHAHLPGKLMVMNASVFQLGWSEQNASRL